MDDSDAQESREELSGDFDVEISDLPPDKGSHYALIRLTRAKKRQLGAAQAVPRIYKFKLTEPDTRATDESEQQEDDNFDLQVNDLPPSRFSHHLLLKLVTLKKRLRAFLPARRGAGAQRGAPLTRAQRRAHSGRALIALGLSMALLVLLAGNVPGLRSQLVGLFERTPTPTPTQTIRFFSSMNVQPGQIVIHGRSGDQQHGTSSETPGSLPSSCPKESSLQTFMTTLDPPGIGGGPIWITGFVGPSAALDNLGPVSESGALSHNPGGWYETLAVFIQKGFSGTITLEGWDQGFPLAHALKFSDKTFPEFRSTFSISSSNMSEHFVPDGSWKMLALNIAVPRAGCYALQATWAGAWWMRYFAAGD